MNKQPHTILDDAADEIRAILKKYDIAAICFMHTPGFGHALYELSPSYSALSFAATTLLFKASPEDFPGDRQARQKAITDTLNLLYCINAAAGPIIIQLMDMEEALNKQFDAVHGPDITMYQPPPPPEKEPEPADHYFQVTAKAYITPSDDMQGCTLHATDYRLDMSDNLDRSQYLDHNDLPNKIGVKAVSTVLATAINSNIYAAHHAKQWDSAEHLRWVMDHLQRLFVENARITKGTM